MNDCLDIEKADTLSEKIQAALLFQSAAYAGDTSSTNLRENVCIAPNCSRKAYASGHCNAHYIRLRKGTDLTAPIKNRKRSRICVDCACETNSKGGWHRCPSCYKSARRKIIKEICVSHKGGVCQSCNVAYPLRVFDFHHVGEKTESPSLLISNRSPDAIAQELEGCVLLCANCHRMEHDDEYN